MSTNNVNILNTNNWYQNMVLFLNGYSNGNISGMNPNIQIRMISAIDDTGTCYSNYSLQKTNGFTLTFQLYITATTLDNISVFFGINDLFTSDQDTNYVINGQSGAIQLIIRPNLNTFKLYTMYGSNTEVGTSTTSVGINTWQTVTITFTPSTTNTWVISYNGTNIITYNDNSYTTFVNNQSTTYGILSQTSQNVSASIKCIDLSVKQSLPLSILKNTYHFYPEECFINKLSTYSQNNAAAAYGLRLLNANYTGPIINIRRGSDNATSDFYADTNGNIGTTLYGNGTSISSWLSGATGYVTRWYDQTNNGRDVINTSNNTSQPTIDLSISNPTNVNIKYQGAQLLSIGTTTNCPLSSGWDNYTYVCDTRPDTLANMVAIDQSSGSVVSNQRACLLFVSAGLYQLNGENNDTNIISYATGVNRKIVMMCNHTLTSENIVVNDNGTIYVATSPAPGNLNVGVGSFIIGRKSSANSEYFTGYINEVIVFRNTLTTKESQLYFTPNAITRKTYRSPPVIHIKDVPKDNGYVPVGAVITLDTQMLNLSNGNAVSTWNGVTGNNSPVYNDTTYSSNTFLSYRIPSYVSITNSSLLASNTTGKYFSAGTRTYNINTNGGFTAIWYGAFTSSASTSERIFDLGNGQANNNLIAFRESTTTNMVFQLYNSSTVYTLTANSSITQNEYAVWTFRYTKSGRVMEILKNGVQLTNGTAGADITDKSNLTNNWIGRSNWGVDYYSNINIVGLYVYDRSLTDEQVASISNHLMYCNISSMPSTIPDYNNKVVRYGSVLSQGWQHGLGMYFNGDLDSYVDIQDIPNWPFTFSFWFYNTSTANTTPISLGSTDSSGGFVGLGMNIDIETSGTVLKPYYWTAASTQNNLTTQAILVNTWYHLTFVVTPTTLAYYLNGSLVQSVTAVLYNTNRIILGKSGDNGRPLKGYIQDFRLYDYALREDEITAIVSPYTGEERALINYNTPANYLINTYNWYSVMNVYKTGTFSVASQQSDPNVQYQLTSTSATNSSNTFFNSTRIQAYNSFTLTFDVYLGNATDDGFYFYCGATSSKTVPTGSGGANSSYYIYFKVSGTKGIYLYDDGGTQLAYSPVSHWTNVAEYMPITIVYNRSLTNTWTVNAAGLDVINFNDSDNTNWVSNIAGDFWGIGARTTTTAMNCYIRRLELHYTPYVNSMNSTINTLNNTKFPAAVMTSNTTTFSGTTILDGAYIASASNNGSGNQPYQAFDNNTGTYTFESGALYTGTNGAYNSASPVSTTVKNLINGSSTSYSGEWLQLQTPNPLQLNSFALMGRQDSSFYLWRTPNTFYIAGSNDGSSWDLIHTTTDAQFTLSKQYFTCNGGNLNRYRYFRLIVTKIGNSGTTGDPSPGWLDLVAWDLFTPINSYMNGTSLNLMKFPSAPLTADSPVSFLTVNTTNWYNLMTVSTNTAFTPTVSGSDPFKQIQMTDGNGGTQGLYITNQPVMNYSSFTYTFQIRCFNNNNGDILTLYFGSGGYYTNLNFQIYSYQGIRLNVNGTTVVSSATNWYDNVWHDIRVVYNRSTTNTWTIFFDETQIIQYSDPNILAAAPGSQWGYSTFNGAARFTSYLRQLEMNIAPASIPGNNVLNGSYTASASSIYNNSLFSVPSNAFSNNLVNGTTLMWHSATNYTNGTYSGAISTSVSGTSYSGEWVQLQAPNALQLAYYSIYPRQDSSLFATRSPKNFIMAGSNDGSTWYLLDSESGITDWTASEKSFICNGGDSNRYKYFRLIVTAVGNTAVSGANSVNITNINLFAPIALSNYILPSTPKGLLDGLTWKYYGGNSGDSVTYYTTNTYTHIGRCTDATNLTTITNSRVIDNTSLQNFSIEIYGYFRATVSGTWTFSLGSDDGSYMWIGPNALSGYTTSNANINNGGGHPFTTVTCTVTLLAGNYYPIRIHFSQGTGGSGLQLGFTPPNGTITYNGQGYFFSGTGLDAAFPQESAKIIKDLTCINEDGVYYILVNGISTPIYCLMNDCYDGGGWMMLMKGKAGDAFKYSSNYWTSRNTLNPGDTTRNTGDAKYDTFNYSTVKDVLAIWPDIRSRDYTNVYGNNGGSIFVEDGWSWLINNWNETTRITPYTGFTTTRYPHQNSNSTTQLYGINNPLTYNGLGTWCSRQTVAYVHGFNVSGTQTGANSGPNVRWGFLFNNQTDLGSCDSYCGIGMGGTGVYVNYSAGDYNNGNGSVTLGINRSAEFQLYGR